MSWHSARTLRSRKVSHAHVTSAVYGRGAGTSRPVRPRLGRLAAPLTAWGQGDSDARLELMELLALGAPFQFRLCGAAAHAWSAEGKHAGHRGRAGPALTAALTGRLAPTAGHWLGIDPDQVEVSIHDESGWGSIELSRAGGERRLRAKLPVSWLAAVWAPGLAVVGHHLVVSVQHAAWPSADVLALPAPGKQPVELTIRHDERGWSVAE